MCSVPTTGQGAQRLRERSASSLRMEMYSQTRVTISPNARYHSCSFGVPAHAGLDRAEVEHQAERGEHDRERVTTTPIVRKLSL